MFTNAVSVVVPFLALFAQPIFAAGCSRTYVVKEGDICDSISKENNVSTYQLAVLNQGIIDPTCSKLLPGQTICLGNKDEDCTATYAVDNGDSCDGIQAKNGINSTLLHMNNPQINEECSNIYIGEVLCVAKTIMVPTVPSHGVSSVVVPPSTAIPANPSATAVHPSVYHTAPHSSATHAPTNSGDNDDDLPYCDEL